MFSISSFTHAKPTSKMCSISLFMFLITQIIFSINAKPITIPSHFSKFPTQLPTHHTLKSSEHLFDQSVQFTMNQAKLALAFASNQTLSFHKLQNVHLIGGMNDCMELLDDTLDQLSNIINPKNSLIQSSHDVQTWLSAALTNQQTCIEGLAKYKLALEIDIMKSMAKNLSGSLSNSLAIYMSTNKLVKVTKGSGNRRLLSINYNNNNGNKFPKWVSKWERKLLEASIEEIEISAVVDKHGMDGTHYKTISEAIGLLGGGEGRTVIYVKAGTYHENLKFSTKQKNVMLVGDGKGKTIIVGDRNAEDGWTTFQSATVAAMGDGFIARDITFVNSAGPAKHQAVALRVGSDKSVIFRCSILGYQDTLYTHSKRQFYRETDIYGTVDFIFGNSAVVFQNCNIFARKPSSTGVHNFITAQGRADPNQNTGISIHNCKIVAASDLAPVKSKYATYLGRPWKQYSRTVIMQSFLDDSINSAGWSPWSGSFGLKTLYYGEYMNSGPGAATSGRVKWPGYEASLTSTEAQAFTVAGFISGHLWLPSTGVSFDSGLLG